MRKAVRSNRVTCSSQSLFRRHRFQNTFTEDELQSFDLLAFDFASKVSGKTKFKEAKLFDPYHLLLGLNSQLPQWAEKKNRCDLFAQLDKTKLLASYGTDAEDAKDGEDSP